MKTVKPKAFMCYLDNYVILEHLSDAQAGRLWKMLFDLAVNGTDGENDDQVVRLAYAIMAQKLKSDFAAYDKKVAVMKENGNKRAKPVDVDKKQIDNDNEQIDDDKKQKQAKACNCSQYKDKDEYEDEDKDEYENEDENEDEDEEEEKIIKKEACASCSAAAASFPVGICIDFSKEKPANEKASGLPLSDAVDKAVSRAHGGRGSPFDLNLCVGLLSERD